MCVFIKKIINLRSRKKVYVFSYDRERKLCVFLAAIKREIDGCLAAIKKQSAHFAAIETEGIGF